MSIDHFLKTMSDNWVPSHTAVQRWRTQDFMEPLAEIIYKKQTILWGTTDSKYIPGLAEGYKVCTLAYGFWGSEQLLCIAEYI